MSTSIIAGRRVLERPRTSMQLRMRSARGKSLSAMELIDEMVEGMFDGEVDVWGTTHESNQVWAGLDSLVF